MYSRQKSLFREIEHTADTGIIAEGTSLESMFASAAFGYYSILYDDFHDNRQKKKEISLREPAREDLLVSWLSELNYLHALESFVVSAIAPFRIIKKDGFFLHVVVYGYENTSGADFQNT